MTQKQTVYLPKDDSKTVFRPINLPVEETIRKEGYFFTPEQLNEYTANVIKQALETAAGNVDLIETDGDPDPESITNTFEETFKQFEV